MPKRAKEDAVRKTKVIGASLDDKDQRRLESYIATMGVQGVKMKPGQAVGALMRRGLDAVEREAGR